MDGQKQKKKKNPVLQWVLDDSHKTKLELLDIHTDAQELYIHPLGGL